MTSEQIEQERAAFEAWYWEYNQIPEHHRARFTGRLSPCEARYEGTAGHTAWQAWLARAQQSAWISVEERLPEINKEVLVAWTDGVVGRARHINDESEKQTWDIYSSYEQIAHWQPLPEPPQDNTNGSAQ
jgi:hypothetical protein|nr:MAG TPA: Protein of unknown function (DUF551) [Caudoviricetes sp.]